MLVRHTASVTSSFAMPAPPPISIEAALAEYRAGACNIGAAEITRRRRTGHAALLLTIVLLAVLVVIGVPPIVRFVIAVPAAVAVACYMEAYLRFCIGFGWLGVFNFGARGSTQRVASSADRAADRGRSIRLSVALGVICIAAGTIAVLLPL